MWTVEISNPSSVYAWDFPHSKRKRPKLRSTRIDNGYFRFKLAVFYDRTWLSKFVTHDESINAVKRIVANAQTIFTWPSLTFPIDLLVDSITFKDLDIPANGTGL